MSPAVYDSMHLHEHADHRTHLQNRHAVADIVLLPVTYPFHHRIISEIPFLLNILHLRLQFDRILFVVYKCTDNYVCKGRYSVQSTESAGEKSK